jgi:hypothetical protein
MAELSFPTKLTRLTKTKLTIVKCCVKLQKNCSNPFETRQGLRQGDDLSTLLFNVVLEAIVRQATGTIFNKQIQLFAYGDDIDIVGRSLDVIHNGYLAGGRSSNSRNKYQRPKDKLHDCGWK